MFLFQVIENVKLNEQFQIHSSGQHKVMQN